MPTIFNKKKDLPAMAKQKVSETNTNVAVKQQQSSKPGTTGKEYSPTQRAIAMLKTAYSHRFITASLLNDLYFPISIINGKQQTHSNCLYHLRQLVANGYVLARKLPPPEHGGRSEHVYLLDRRGAETLAALWGCSVADLDWDRTDRAIRITSLPHYVACSEVRVRVTLSVRKHRGFYIEQWLDERDVQRKHKGVKVAITTPEGKQHHVSLEPDAFFLLTTPRQASDEPQRYFRFVEVDLGTEPIEASQYDRSSFIKKVLSYLEFYRSDQYHRLYGAKGMVILTVTTTERRLTSMLQATEQAGGRERFWFTTRDRIKQADILSDPVWSLITRPERSSLVW
jgi:Replication-relaxation